jgi:hypothetical protein
MNGFSRHQPLFLIVRNSKVREMNDLIEALQIFAKYRNPRWPTRCEHELLMIMEVKRHEKTDDEIARLEELGFVWSHEYDCYVSHRFGSA